MVPQFRPDVVGSELLHVCARLSLRVLQLRPHLLAQVTHVVGIASGGRAHDVELM
jgi:hypothetical protein